MLPPAGNDARAVFPSLADGAQAKAAVAANRAKQMGVRLRPCENRSEGPRRHSLPPEPLGQQPSSKAIPRRRAPSCRWLGFVPFPTFVALFVILPVGCPVRGAVSRPTGASRWSAGVALPARNPVPGLAVDPARHQLRSYQRTCPADAVLGAGPGQAAQLGPPRLHALLGRGRERRGRSAGLCLRRQAGTARPHHTGAARRLRDQHLCDGCLALVLPGADADLSAPSAAADAADADARAGVHAPRSMRSRRAPGCQPAPAPAAGGAPAARVLGAGLLPVASASGIPATICVPTSASFSMGPIIPFQLIRGNVLCTQPRPCDGRRHDRHHGRPGHGPCHPAPPCRAVAAMQQLPVLSWLAVPQASAYFLLPLFATSKSPLQMERGGPNFESHCSALSSGLFPQLPRCPPWRCGQPSCPASCRSCPPPDGRGWNCRGCARRPNSSA